MTEFVTLDFEDLDDFQNEINRYCSDGSGRVISSNAFSINNTVRYYALIEQFDHQDQNPHSELLSYLGGIDSHLSLISSYTADTASNTGGISYD